MVIAVPLTLGPWRAVFGEPSFHYQVGYLEGTGVGALVPATVLLAWALGAAWFAVAKERGRWMLFGATGDALMAVNIGVTVVANRSALTTGRIQAGEYFTITGGELVAAILVALVTPLVASSVWAFRRLADSPPILPRRSPMEASADS